MRRDVIGFDAEYHFSLPVIHPGTTTKPRSHRGPGIAILQLSAPDRVLIMDVPALLKSEERTDWWFLGRLFTDPERVKVGFGFQSDLALISKSIPKLARHLQRRVNCIDLETVVENLESLVSSKESSPNVSLAKAVKQFLGANLDKSVQRSNWDLRPLRPKQINYAALDAYVLLPLHEQIEKKISEAEIDYEISQLALRNFKEDGKKKSASLVPQRTVCVIPKDGSGSAEVSASGPSRQYSFGRGSSSPSASVRDTEIIRPVGSSVSSSVGHSLTTSYWKKLSFGRGSNVSFTRR